MKKGGIGKIGTPNTNRLDKCGHFAQAVIYTEKLAIFSIASDFWQWLQIFLVMPAMLLLTSVASNSLALSRSDETLATASPYFIIISSLHISGGHLRTCQLGWGFYPNGSVCSSNHFPFLFLSLYQTFLASFDRVWFSSTSSLDRDSTHTQTHTRQTFKCWSQESFFASSFMQVRQYVV